MYRFGFLSKGKKENYSLLIQCGELRCKSIMCGERLQLQLWFLAVFFLLLFLVHFFARWGGQDVGFFFFFFNVQHLPCTVVRHLSVASWKPSVEPKNTGRVSLVEASVAVKLPRWPCSKNHWLLCGRLWILSGRFEAESYSGDHLVTSDLDFCASSQKERWSSKKPQKNTFPKSRGGQK